MAGDIPSPPPSAQAPVGPGPAARPPRGLLLVCLVAALVFRVIGLTYGLPDWLHSDTPKQLHRVVRFMSGDFVPDDTYPTLHMYVVALLLRVTLFILDPGALELGPSWTQVVVTARLLNAGFGTATVLLLYYAARRLFGPRVGILASALLALSQVSIVHAHYEMGDVPQAFFVTAAFATAARALVGGHPAAYLATGALAGLAASAKYFGVVVFVTVLVVAAAARHLSRARTLALVAGSGVLTGLVFVLTTPMVLLAPRLWLNGIRTSRELLVGAPSSPLEGLIVGSRALLGLSLEWVGFLGCVVALAGVVVLVRRGWRGTLVLSTPLAVLAIYIWFRPHGLDDRYLVILAPFLALSAAVAVDWLARSWRVAAAIVALGLLGVSMVHAVNASALFWEDDTDVEQARWMARHVPPGLTIVRGLPRYARLSGASRRRGLLVSDTQSDDRARVWYASRPTDRVRRIDAEFVERGKLLRRFELLPRGMTSPTIVNYDLDTMDVPYAFPPPDDVVSGEHRVFLDGDTVPDRAAVVVEPDRSVRLTILARAPLPRLELAVSGAGRLQVREGFRSRSWPVSAERPRVITLHPWRSLPWFKYVYRLRLKATGGRVAVRVLQSSCEVAERHLDDGQWAEAIERLEACRGTRWIEPARLWELTWAHARAGQPEAAQRALTALEREAPGLLGGLVGLAGHPDGDQWRQRYAALIGRPSWFWWGHTFRVQAEDSPMRVGAILDDDHASGRAFVRMESGAGRPAYLKVWFPQSFLRGRYVAIFRLRASAPGSGPVATLDVVRHHPQGGYDIEPGVPWVPCCPGAWEDAVVPFATTLEPGGVELRFLHHGRGTVDIDHFTVMPDVRSGLTERLAALRVLIPAVAAAVTHPVPAR